MHISISCNIRRNKINSSRRLKIHMTSFNINFLQCPPEFIWLRACEIYMNCKIYQNTFNWIKVVHVHITPSSRKLSGWFSCKLCQKYLSQATQSNTIHISNTWVDHPPPMILFVCHLTLTRPSSSAMVSILHFCTIYFFMWIIIWLYEADCEIAIIESSQPCEFSEKSFNHLLWSESCIFCTFV